MAQLKEITDIWNPIISSSTANNYIDFYGKRVDINSFIDFTEDLENILFDFVNFLVKKSLSDINFDHYYLVGGKALNKIISRNYLQPSFDFDIHLFGEDENKIN